MFRIPPPYRILRRIKQFFGYHENRYLAQANGIIHVGGNTGQEREEYASHDLPVLWIEPIPEVYNTLVANLAGYPKQSAVQALVTDTDGKKYEFNIASNNGASSSIFQLGQHSDMWPDVTYTRTVSLISTTLDKLSQAQATTGYKFDTLVMDTQGSELMVLQGGACLLDNIRIVKTEAADFAAYDGCCTRTDLVDYLQSRGFQLIFEDRFAYRQGIGAYFTLVFSR